MLRTCNRLTEARAAIRRLEEDGYRVLENVVVVGESSIDHRFDFVIEGSPVKVAVRFRERITPMDIMRAIAEIVDTGLSQVILCNEVDEEARELAKHVIRLKLLPLDKSDIERELRDFLEDQAARRAWPSRDLLILPY